MLQRNFPCLPFTKQFILYVAEMVQKCVVLKKRNNIYSEVYFLIRKYSGFDLFSFFYRTEKNSDLEFNDDNLPLAPPPKKVQKMSIVNLVLFFFEMLRKFSSKQLGTLYHKLFLKV